MALLLVISAVLPVLQGCGAGQEAAQPVSLVPVAAEGYAPDCADIVRMADTVSAASAVRAMRPELRVPDMRVRVRRGDSLVLRAGGLTLTATDSAVVRRGEYSVTALWEGELPPMPGGMVNVTAMRGDGMVCHAGRCRVGDGGPVTGGYRLLPSGRNFSPYAELRLAYDESLLPMGYTPDDIHTSYYDEAAGSWVRLERVAVDTARREIVSLTDHFTDFVNEVLKSPEMPETQAFVPTMMTELEAANPMEGETLIQPPTANNEGTAALSYPLDIPAGRGGMQPSLTMTYNSDGGPGWLGVGWDIPIPTISVDTRWGVPRYDKDHESETYMYRGEQLVATGSDGSLLPLPHRTNTWAGRLPDGTRFLPRVDMEADSIVRHGSKPSEYWWEVWDRNGVVHRFGHYETLSDDANPSTLADDRGNVARWCLTESEDASGNLVRYTYDTVNDCGIARGHVKGRQVYPAEIRYTLHRDATGAVDDTGHRRIVFFREDNDIARARSRCFQSQSDISAVIGARVPSVISCRAGFKEVTASLLSHVWLYWDKEVMRAWIFGMRCDAGTGHHVRLVTMKRVDVMDQCNDPMQYKYDEKGVIYRGLDGSFGSFRFVYSPQPAVVFDHAVDMGQVWSAHSGNSFPYSQDVMNIGFITGATTAIGNALTTTALTMGKGRSWSVGGGVSAGFGFNVFWTELACGGNYTYSHNVDRGVLTLADIDGDGLPDKLFRDNLGRVFYRPNIRLTDNTFYFGSARRIESLDDFRLTKGGTHEVGLQASLGISATASWAWGKSHTTDYLADVNGDGLPDAVTDCGVFYNDPVGGVPHFSRSPRQADPSGVDTVRTSTMPCGEILYDGEVNDSIYCPKVKKIKTVDYSDFVNSSIARFREILDSISYADFIDSGFTITGIVDYTISGYRLVRDCSLREYRAGLTFDGMPRTESVRVWCAPRGGQVSVRDSIRLLPDPTGAVRRSRYADGVDHCVTWYKGVQSVDDTALTSTSAETPVQLSGHLGTGDTVFVTKVKQITVSKGDLLMFRLQSGMSDVGDRVERHSKVTYSSPDPGNDVYGRPRGVFSSHDDFVLSGDDIFQAPCDGTLNLDIDIGTGDLRSGNTPTGVVITVRRNNTLLNTYTAAPNTAQHTISVSLPGAPTHDISLDSGDSVIVSLSPASGGGTTWGAVTCVPRYTFTPSHSAYILGSLSYCVAPRIPSLRDSVSGAHATLFGPMYRHWGQFAFRSDGTDPADEIPLSALRCRLVRNFAGADTTVMDEMGSHISEGCTFDEFSAAMTATGNYNPLDAGRSRWLRMSPDCLNGAWQGYGRTTALTRTMMTNVCPREWYAEGEALEAVEYDCPAPAPTPEYPNVKTQAIYCETKTDNASLGVGVGPLSLGTSWSKGSCSTLADCMDLNGDRYPDLISEGGVQYTMPWGGLGKNADDVMPGVPRNTSRSSGTNVAPGDKSQNPRPMFGRLTSGSKECSPPDRAAAVNVTQPTLGGGMVGGSDTSGMALSDINGDGLPDIVYDDGTVRLNAGYGFLPAETWDCGAAHTGSYLSGSGSLSVSPSFSLGKFSIGGGVSMGLSINWTGQQLCDINGDGLTDRLEKTSTGVKLHLNLGNGSWKIIPLDVGEVSRGLSWNECANASVTLGTTLGFAKVTFSVSGTPIGRSFSGDNVMLADLNGDGLPDYATSSGESDMEVRHNMYGGAGLLRNVIHLGDTLISLEYAFTPPTYDSPQGHWDMASLRVHGDPDMGVPDGYSTFSYESPRHDRYERVPLGYATVTATQHTLSPSGQRVPYRKIVDEYHNGSYMLKGRKSATRVTDALDNIFDETLYDIVAVSLDSHGGDCPSATAVTMERTVTNHYEGGGAPLLTTAISMAYDSRRNIVHYINWGDTNYGGDDFCVHMEYLPHAQRNMVALRTLAEVRGGRLASGPLLRRTEFLHDSRGNITRRTDTQSQGVTAETDLVYDDFGNATRITLPPNAAGQRMEVTTVYDPVLHMLPVSHTDSYGLSRSMTWNNAICKPLSVTDPAGNTTRYTYDCRGNVETVMGPLEAASGASWTWSASRDYRFASTEHYDSQNPYDPIRTETVCDRFGRVTQVRNDASVGGQTVMRVSGRTQLDPLGRAVRQHDPGVCTTSTHQYLTTPTPRRTVTEYDILDRVVGSTTFNGSETLTGSSSYSYVTTGGRTLLRTAVTDPLGRVTVTLSDALGRTLRSTDPDGGVTDFTVDLLGNILSATDPEGFTTTYTYDLAGRPTSRAHPDAGTTTTAYDRAGNITSLTNGDNETVTISYHYNRPTLRHFPRIPENDVSYVYDNSGRLSEVTDGSGRATMRYDAMGNISSLRRSIAAPSLPVYTFTMGYEYDSWGRMLSMTYPDGETVGYSYDAGGNLFSMDGTKGGVSARYVTSTTYDINGNRTSVEYGNGSRMTCDYDSLSRLARLSSTAIRGGVTVTMQDIEYTFDDVGDITGLTNSAAAIGTLGGPYTNEYTYDLLGRLEEAVSGYGQGSTLTMAYSPSGRLCSKRQSGTARELVFWYDNSVRPHAPRVADDANRGYTLLRWDKRGNLAQADTYSRAGAFTSLETGRHLYWTEDSRLASVVDDRWYSHYAYDAGGERVIKITGQNNVTDINANRMRCTAVLDEVTLYVSPYLVATNSGYTKHYWAGPERVCSAIGSGGLDYMQDFIGIDQDLTGNADALLERVRSHMMTRSLPQNNYQNMSSPCGETGFSIGPDEGPEQVDASVQPGTVTFAGSMIRCREVFQTQEPLFFFHGDHLGSASWVTDGSGAPVQHLQYHPFGEPFVNQHTTGYEERFTFTGKERDAETGFSYYGARYYDPELSTLFLSVDPCADKYNEISPYHYCHWNPIKHIDPNGEDEWEINQSGTIVNRIITEKHDAFFIVDENGNRMMDENHMVQYRSISFEYGSISELQQNNYFIPPTGFKVNENSNGVELFKFLADNTNVEFGLVTSKESGAYILTNHDISYVGATNIALFLDRKGETILTVSHNHPGNSEPSGFNKTDTHGDRFSAQRLVISHGKVVDYFVYTKKSQQFTMYDGQNIYNSLTYSSFMTLIGR